MMKNKDYKCNYCGERFARKELERCENCEELTCEQCFEDEFCNGCY